MKTIAKDIVTQITDFISGGLLEKIKDLTTEEIDKKNLINKIKIYAESYFDKKFNSLPNDEAYDFTGLNEFINDELFGLVLGFLTETDPRKRARLKEHVFAQAYVAGGAATATLTKDVSARQKAIYIYLECILEIIEKHFLSDVDNEYLILGQKLQAEIINQINDSKKHIVDQIKTAVEYDDSFAQMVDNLATEEQSDNASVFHYLNPKIGYYGRKEELDFLEAFLASPKPVQLLAAVGSGGTGKSKLLYHFSIENKHRLDWKIVWPRDASKLPDFNSWQYHKNVMLIFDYSERFVDDLGRWIDKVAGSDPAVLPDKLRIVILERSGLSTDKNDDIIYPYWYTKLQGTGSRARAVKDFTHENENGFLELSPMSDAELFSMIDDIAKARGKAIDDAEKSKILDYTRRIEKIKNTKENGRPLITLLVADAALRELTYDKWDITTLIKKVIDKYQAYWKEALCDDNDDDFKALKHMLMFATATGGWNIECEDPPEAFMEYADHIRDKESNYIKQLFCGATDKTIYDERLSPFEPDILGEAFVLDMLLNKTKAKRQAFVDALWNCPEEFAQFLNRAMETYYDEPKFRDLFGNNMKELLPTNTDENNAENYSNIVFSQTYYSSDPVVLAEAIGILQQLAEYYKENGEIVLAYANGLFNDINKRPDNGAANLAELKRLAEEYKENGEIVLRYAKGLVNDINNRPDNAAANLAELERIMEEHKDLFNN